MFSVNEASRYKIYLRPHFRSNLVRLAHKTVEFVIKNVNKSIVEVSREMGYVIIDTKENGEYNLVRRVGINNYPRFHVYLKQSGSNYDFSLHLDQKQPIYEAKGVHAHSGEYFGPVVDNEADRIKNILLNSI